MRPDEPIGHRPDQHFDEPIDRNQAGGCICEREGRRDWFDELGGANAEVAQPDERDRQYVGRSSAQPARELLGGARILRSALGRKRAKETRDLDADLGKLVGLAREGAMHDVEEHHDGHHEEACDDDKALDQIDRVVEFS